MSVEPTDIHVVKEGWVQKRGMPCMYVYSKHRKSYWSLSGLSALWTIYYFVCVADGDSEAGC